MACRIGASDRGDRSFIEAVAALLRTDVRGWTQKIASQVTYDKNGDMKVAAQLEGQNTPPDVLSPNHSRFTELPKGTQVVIKSDPAKMPKAAEREHE